MSYLVGRKKILNELHGAAERGDLDLVKRLVKQGVPLNEGDRVRIDVYIITHHVKIWCCQSILSIRYTIFSGATYGNKIVRRSLIC